jgi:hypothetical protein
MLEFGRCQTFGERSTSMRMYGTLRVRSDRKCNMDKPLGSSIKRSRLAEGRAKLLKGRPDIGVVARDVRRDRGQGNPRILRKINR